MSVYEFVKFQNGFIKFKSSLILVFNRLQVSRFMEEVWMINLPKFIAGVAQLGTALV